MTESSILKTGFVTHPIEMQSMWLVTFLAPEEDVDRVFEAIAEIAPLKQDNTDQS